MQETALFASITNICDNTFAYTATDDGQRFHLAAKSSLLLFWLRLSGKSYKSAVIAMAHKMLKIAHALLKSGTKWENKLTG
ncbi:hypothetical protein FACS1894170_03350 [Planctomycetales bacterium]|nr:hypothetical protein FACS1894170_03350 [Planctomycetales bacterium]